MTPTNNRVLQQEVRQLLHDRKKQIASLKVPVEEHTGEQLSNNELSASPAQGMLAKHPALLQIQSPTFNAFTPSPKFRSFPNTNDTSGGKDFSYQSAQKGLASPSSHLLAMPHRNTPQQALKNALRTVYSDDPLSPSIAATKISIWWRFLIPRRRLAFRMQRRTAVRVIIWEVVELSMHKSILRYKRRHRMLRNGAATKIQRWVRRKVLNRFGRLPGSSMHRHSGRSRSRSNSHVMISSSRNVEHGSFSKYILEYTINNHFNMIFLFRLLRLRVASIFFVAIVRSSDSENAFNPCCCYYPDLDSTVSVPHETSTSREVQYGSSKDCLYHMQVHDSKAAEEKEVIRSQSDCDSAPRARLTDEKALVHTCSGRG